MRTKIFLFFVIIFLFLACKNTTDTEKIVIASQQGDCVGVAPMKCFWIKVAGQSDWEFFYDTIDGFVYEPGYEYILEIKRDTILNPAADQSAFKYTLVRQLSKERKDSQGLPVR